MASDQETRQKVSAWNQGKMIFFARSFVADLDGRLSKYFAALDAAGLAYHFIGWNKDGSAGSDIGRQTLFPLKAALGGGWRNAVALLRFNVFLFCALWRARRSVQVVHAVDLDCAVTSWAFCKIFRKRLVFDIYDKYTAVRNISGFAGKVLDTVERSIGKSADLTLIVSEDRFVQHGFTPAQKNVRILENVPATILVEVTDRAHSAPPWQIGYFGVLERRHRGLEDLLAACAGRSEVELHVAGYGSLADTFEAAARKFQNVSFYGAMQSSEGLALMAKMDVLVGMYYLTVPNHAFASPNKYYEHLKLRRGMLSTAGTPPAAKIVAQGSGWAIGEGTAAIASWLDSLDEIQILAAGWQAGRVWDEKFSSYYLTHYQGLYVTCIKELLEK
jgi:glycosyltransferase involved in cell wall biosynthesis